MQRVSAFLGGWLAALMAISPSFAQPLPKGELPSFPAPLARFTLTLERCLELAEQNYPKVQEAGARLEQKRAQVTQAKWAPYFDFTASGGLALAPTVRGTVVYSPDTDAALTSHMGLAWSVGVEGVVPLWTFGKITNTWALSQAQVKVGELEIRKEKNELRLSVRRVYYGVQLARDALSLIREARERIDKHLGQLAEQVAAGEGSEVDLLRLRMYGAELRARESEALKQEATALSGLRFLTGLRGTLELPEKPLRQVPHRLGPLARYLTAARLHRPEVNMAKAGILAREAQVRIEQARYLPDLGLGMNARVARAPLVTDQRNPFVKDTVNVVFYGAALVLRSKLDFLPQAARVAQAAAELEAMRATERYALGGVGSEVEQAFFEAEDAERRLEAYAQAASYAKQWLIQVQQGIDVGTYEDEDVIDPAKEYALKRFAQMSAVFDYNVAVSKLALTTGWDGIASEGQ